MFFFFLEQKEMSACSLNKGPIYCPECGRKVGTYDGRSQINKSVRCANCNKIVLFNVCTGETSIKPIPGRTQSSGKRFY